MRVRFAIAANGDQHLPPLNESRVLNLGDLGFMRTLLAGSTVFITIVASLAFGIACGYLAIAAILRLVGHKPPSPAVPTHPAAATSSSGD
jgi:hypothetical protein